MLGKSPTNSRRACSHRQKPSKAWNPSDSLSSVVMINEQKLRSLKQHKFNPPQFCRSGVQVQRGPLGQNKVSPGPLSFLEGPGINPSSSSSELLAEFNSLQLSGLRSLFLARGQRGPLRSLRPPASSSHPPSIVQPARAGPSHSSTFLLHPSATSLLLPAEECFLLLRAHLIKRGSLQSSRMNFLF